MGKGLVLKGKRDKFRQKRRIKVQLDFYSKNEMKDIS